VARARLKDPKTTDSMSSMAVIVKSGMSPPVARWNLARRPNGRRVDRH
jgi:hypothetical protein